VQVLKQQDLAFGGNDGTSQFQEQLKNMMELVGQAVNPMNTAR
jgi:hypothetical protein